MQIHTNSSSTEFQSKKVAGKHSSVLSNLKSSEELKKKSGQQFLEY